MNTGLRLVFGSCAVGGLALIAAGLYVWGAKEVRGDLGEVMLLTLAGGVWLLLAAKLFPWLGLSLRDDVAERGNIAALVGLCGALTAFALIYVGGSLGEGPSYANNFFSVALGSAGLLVLWILLEVGGQVSMSVAEERDLASGLRLSGFLLAIGLILGRAVAGDWHSEEATVHDFFRDGWPAIVLWAFALIIERCTRPNRQVPFPRWPTRGLLPASLYLALTAAWLWHLGPWEGMPK